MIPAIIFVLSILIGQLLKLPLSGNPGPTFLDIYIFLLTIFGLYKLKFKLAKPPFFLTGGFIFSAVAVISLIFTPLHLVSSEYIISFSYNLRFTLYLTAVWIIYSGAFENLKKILPAAVLVSGFGLAILGLLQLFFLPDLKFLAQWGWDPHYFRTVSTFLDPNFAGAFFVLTLIYLTAYLREKYNAWKIIPKIYYLVYAVVYLALLTTFSRSSYLMFLISSLIFSVLAKSKKLFLISILLFIILIGNFNTYTRTVAAPRNINRTESAVVRLNTWKQGLILFESYPVLGVGFNAYKFALRENKLASEQFLNNHGSSTNDSSLLYVAATTGILGLISYLLFLFTLIKSGINEKILPAVIPGLVIQSFFTNSLFYPFILIWIMLIALPLHKHPKSA